MKTWREHAARVAWLLAAMSFGGAAVLRYLTSHLDPVPPLVATLDDRSLLPVLGSMMLATWLDGYDRDAGDDPSPAVSGTLTVVSCGLAAATVLYWFGASGSRLLYALLALVATGVLGFAVYRFASANAASIGEARFPTTPNDG